MIVAGQKNIEQSQTFQLLKDIIAKNANTILNDNDIQSICCNMNNDYDYTINVTQNVHKFAELITLKSYKFCHSNLIEEHFWEDGKKLISENFEFGLKIKSYYKDNGYILSKQESRYANFNMLKPNAALIISHVQREGYNTCQTVQFAKIVIYLPESSQ